MVFKTSYRKIIENIIEYVVVFYVLYMSGSMLINAYGSAMFRLNMFIAISALGYFLFKHRFKLKILQNVESVPLFILIVFINIPICVYLWKEYDYLNLYLTNAFMILICFAISYKFNYQVFVDKYIKVLTVLSFISLIGFSMTNILLQLPGWEVVGTFRYKSFFIYNILLTNTERNCGIFWEPGMYQGFLAVAILFIELKNDLRGADYLKLLILYITLVTTYSTTGFAMIAALIGFMLIKNTSSKAGRYGVLFISVVIIGIVLMFANSIIALFLDRLPEVVTSKIVDKNISYTTRQFSMIYDFMLVLKYPIGVGRLQVNNLIESIGFQSGSVIASRTNTIGTAFVHFGIFGGLTYLWIWIKACFSVTKNNILNAMIFIIMMILINTEPHMYSLIFNVIAFYWIRLIHLNKKEVRVS